MMLGYKNTMNLVELRELSLRRLQYLFFSLMLVCIIILVWFPSHWVQIVGTAVLLLIAGAACKSGRSE